MVCNRATRGRGRLLTNLLSADVWIATSVLIGVIRKDGQLCGDLAARTLACYRRGRGCLFCITAVNGSQYTRKTLDIGLKKRKMIRMLFRV